MNTQRAHTDASIGPRGVTVCHTSAELLTALATGGKRILAGKGMVALEACLPPTTEHDVLVVVLESWMAHERAVVEALASAIHHRAHLVPAQLPTLHLALAELVANAVEHGNLGLTGTRDGLVNDDDWFTAYQARVRAALASPLGSKPVVVVAQRKGGFVEVSVLDDGEGFDAHALLTTTLDNGPTGRGLPLLLALLDNQLAYTLGGRKATFRLHVRPNHDAMMPTRASIREHGRVLLLTMRPHAFQPLCEALEHNGFQQVHMATEALTQLEAIEQYRPRLVLLDDNLPNLASPTLLHDIASDKERGTAVILLGDSPTVDDRMQAYHLGAADYLPLASDPHDVLMACEKTLLQTRTNHKLSRMARKLSADLEQARMFQHDLLPDAATLTNLARRHRMDMAVHYQACDTLAGDYWTVRHLDTNHLGICIVDFTGHGILAALNTVQLHTLLHGESDLHHPEAVALLLNHHLGRLLSAGSFATYFYGVLNTRTGHLAYCAGGAPPAIVRHTGGKFSTLITSGLPLAISPELPLETRHVDLKDGDTLVLYSDALTDTLHTNGQRWEVGDVLRLISEAPPNATPHTLISHVLDTFYATAHLPVMDDLTLLVLRRATTCAV